jgi:hypothetical protein
MCGIPEIAEIVVATRPVGWRADYGSIVEPTQQIVRTADSGHIPSTGPRGGYPRERSLPRKFVVQGTGVRSRCREAGLGTMGASHGTPLGVNDRDRAGEHTGLRAHSDWRMDLPESREKSTNTENKKPDAISHVGLLFSNTPGSDLLSHAVSHTVPSTVAGLTSVFGMGTGVALLL